MEKEREWHHVLSVTKTVPYQVVLSTKFLLKSTSKNKKRVRTGGGLIKSKNLDFKTHYTHKEQKLQTLLTESAIEFEIQTIVCIEIERGREIGTVSSGFTSISK